jgi:2-oxoglutarate dehydrogenase E2 component (dihydrolipoamide succinyltransferase)
MNEFEFREPSGPVKARAAHDRNAALGRLARTRRWVAGGAAALTAAFAALVSTITPGHTASASARSASPASANTGSSAAPRSRLQMPPLASAGELGLQAPGNAPQPAPQPTPSASPDQSAGAPAPAPAPATPAAPAAVSGGS